MQSSILMFVASMAPSIVAYMDDPIRANVQANFRNLFDSLTRKDHKTVNETLNILNQEITQGNQAFDSMNIGLQSALGRRSNVKKASLRHRRDNLDGKGSSHPASPDILRTYFWLAKPNLFCDPVHESTEPLYMYHAFLVYLYFIAKITELLDTVFFILRKKWNQVSPLHVWHHSGMVFIAWVGVKYVPGGHTMPICALNSFVHIIMYVYYLLLSVRPELRTSLWWKKYITQLQLTQFVIILMHHVSAFTVNCGYPRGISYAILNNLIFIALLFADFYRRAYMMTKKSATKSITRKLD